MRTDGGVSYNFFGVHPAEERGFESGDHEQKAKNLILPCAAEIR